MKGKILFITFEGPDGSGKTTTINSLKKYLKEKNIDFIFTREPGGSNMEEANKIRDIILNPKYNIPPMAEAILYAADRRLNLEKNIWPALKNNKIVFCDRYIDSSFAYQGFARHLGIKKIKNLQDVITEKTYPDLTIFFDITPENALARINFKKNKDRLELEDNTFRENVYKGYKKAMKIHSKRFKIVDASQNKEKVLEDVIQIINKSLKI